MKNQSKTIIIRTIEIIMFILSIIFLLYGILILSLISCMLGGFCNMIEFKSKIQKQLDDFAKDNKK